ncbi:hypothetical protein MSAN_00021800 [Mycena sanguinolenta]|uniref:Uncharacterized protein n=1 Tax=Mycena sanguinolenta TaxID=230812 RepID=A0A8H6ZIA8_9AGAR|nr:hypothetical protein MSAN_00021800 [Mycena sanguinolenta]
MLTAALAVLGTPVHGTLFPYVWGSTLHALRISLVFLTNVKTSGHRLSWGAHMFGFLFMCWGGTFACHLLLSLPPPQLYAPGPWINYSAVHLFLTLLFHYFPIVARPLHHKRRTLPSRRPPPCEQRLPGVISPLKSVHQSPPRRFPLFHFILGAAAASGGGLLGGTLNLSTPNWHFSTPPPLRTGVWGVWSTLDIWAGGVVASTYGFLTAHPAFQPLRASIGSPGISIREARTVSAGLMILFFGARVWLPPLLAARPAPPVVEKPSEKLKTQ